MSFIGFPVADTAVAELSKVEVPGTRQDPSTYHITALYIGKEIPIDTIMGAIRVTYDYCSEQQPVRVRTTLVDAFPANPDDGVPVIARIESPDLMRLQAGLKEAFAQNDIPFSNKYPEYKPHVTLAYDDADARVEPQTIPVVEWTVDHMIIWCGDHDDSGMTVKVPLGTPTVNVEAAMRVVRAGLVLYLDRT